MFSSIILSNFRLGTCITIWNLVIFKIWPGHVAAGNAGLILYLDTKFPDPFYADFFIVLLTAIDGKHVNGDVGSKTT